jgi:hypothetical protein
MNKTLELMLPYLPAVSPNHPRSNTSLPPPIYSIDPLPVPLTEHVRHLSVSPSKSDSHISVPLRAIDEINGHDDPGGGKPDDWIWARLSSTRRVTKGDWFQDVREFELEIGDPKL